MTWQMAAFWKCKKRKKKKQGSHKWMGIASLLESKISSPNLKNFLESYPPPPPFPALHLVSTRVNLNLGWHGKIPIDEVTSLLVDKMENNIQRGKRTRGKQKFHIFNSNKHHRISGEKLGLQSSAIERGNQRFHRQASPCLYGLGPSCYLSSKYIG